MRYFAEDVDLVIGKFCQFGCLFELISVHDFNCIEKLVFFVLCFVDVTVLS